MYLVTRLSVGMSLSHKVIGISYYGVAAMVLPVGIGLGIIILRLGIICSIAIVSKSFK